MFVINTLKSPLRADFFLLLIFLFPLFALGQGRWLRGRVYDQESGQVLSFASVSLKGENTGIHSDLDGKFELYSSTNTDTLLVSYIGYHIQVLPLSGVGQEFKIYLQPKEVRTEELLIVPEDNPAESIMRLAIRNRRQNDFNELPAWRYDSYNKVYIFPVTQSPDSSLSGSEKLKQDSILHGIDSLARAMHLFLWESVTHKEYKRPGKSKETILASRSSGFKDAVLPLLPADVMDFSSFYKDWISVLGQSFLSPLNPEALSKYVFEMRDTLEDGPDSIFAIAFYPRKKSFNGFEGLLHIHSGKYALQHIRAQLSVQAQDQLISGGSVEQLFQKVQDSVWFPSQLVTTFEVGTAALAKDLSNTMKLRMAAKVYLKHISLNPDSGLIRFGPESIVTDANASRQSDVFWNLFREDSLDARERNTYRKIDSLGRKFRFDRWAYQGQKIAQGKISWRYLDFDLARLFQYNLVEKFRLGIGVETNERIASWFSLGGWAGWAWADQTMKYGGFAKIMPFDDKRWQLEYRYEYDLLESASSPVMMSTYQKTSDLLGRNLRMRIMEYQTSRRLTFRHPIWNNWTQELTLQQADILPAYEYLYRGLASYYLNEFIWDQRYAPGEKFLKNGPFRISLGSSLPVFRFRFLLGRNWPDGLGLNYQVFSASMVHTLNLHTRGKFQLALQGNYGEGNLPYSRLQVLRGNDDKSWPLSAPMSFNTMRFNEFAADQSAQLHLRYDFNNLLFHSRTWHPNFLLEYNAAWGRFTSDVSQHQLPFALRAPDKFYQEAGLVMQNILPKEWVRRSPSLALLGLGFYYRLGAYSLPEPTDNFSFKLYSGFRF